MKINENQKEELLEFIKKNYNENLGLSNLRDLIYKKFSVLYHTSSVKYWVKIATNDQWLKELREKQEQMLKWKKEAEKVDVSEKEEIYLENLDNLFKGKISNKEFEDIGVNI